MEYTPEEYLQNIKILVQNLKNANMYEYPIAVYGLGVNAKFVLEALDSCDVIGLLDRDEDNVGKAIFNRLVISAEEAKKKAKVIVIAADPTNWEVIFKRISNLKYESGIEIFYMNGEVAVDNHKIEEVSENPYWYTGYDELKAKVDSHQVISFDVFDTLLARTIAKPTDLFELMERKLGGSTGSLNDFARCRKEAEMRAAAKAGGICSLDDIYVEIQNCCDLCNTEIAELKNTEISIELEFAAPRSSMAELMRYCRAQGKTVNIISDMYLSSAVIETMLNKCGFKREDYDTILISCELGKSKRIGDLWDYYKQLNKGKSCLHIGDNEQADIKNASARGIDTFRVLGEYDLLCMSTARDLCGTKSLEDRVALGLVMNRLLNCPFSLNKTKGKLAVDEFIDFGYAFFGPVSLLYFLWLISEIKKDGVQLILFLARDGYFLEKLYNKIISIISIESPKGIYFKTSRRMATVAALRSEEDIFAALQDSYTGSIHDLLLDKFGIDIDESKRVFESDIEIEKEENVCNTDYKVKRIVASYVNEILSNAADERECYFKYIASLHLDGLDNAKIAVCDQGIKGTIQYWLNKLMGKTLMGYYFIAFTGEENLLGLGENVKALYPVSNHCKKEDFCNLYRYQPLFEAVFTAPEGSYIRAERNGGFEQSKLFTNQKKFDDIQQIYNGIEAFVTDYLKFYSYGLNAPDSKLADELFGLPMDGRSIIKEKIKQVCCFENTFGGIVSERNVFE